MHVVTLTIIVLCGIIAPVIPQAYLNAIHQLYTARLVVESSRDPCPILVADRLCEWRVEARAQGVWTRCEGTRPPSGAALASHRYFKIIAKCQFGPGIPLLLPPQVVYR